MPDDKHVTFNNDQNRRIRDAVRKSERHQPRFRPQAIKPRFGGGKGENVYRFELAEELELGGRAKAYLLTFKDGHWTTEHNEEAEITSTQIEVCDWYGYDNPFNSPGMWTGPEGAHGLCIKRPETFTDDGGTEGTDDDTTRQIYDVVFVEQVAAWIRWTAYEDQGADNSFLAYVAAFDHQGLSPVEDGGDTIRIYDGIGTDRDIVQGCKGHAFYDYSEKKYYILGDHEGVAEFASAQLTEDCCALLSSVGIDNFSVINRGGLKWYPPPDDPMTASNPAGHAGMKNDYVLLMRSGVVSGAEEGDPFGWNWQIIDVTKHAQEFVIDYRYGTGAGGATFLQKKSKSFYVEACDDTDPDWDDIIEIKSCGGS